MEALIVNIKVKPDKVEAFRAVSAENAAASRKEPGIARFDVLQDAQDPTHFVLYEAYRNPGANALHRETSHYKKWKELAEPMMAEPRTRASYIVVE
jgi:quinol monooxygenase YgiN